MPDKPLPFVVNDRRKFTPEGELRPDAEPRPTEVRQTEEPQKPMETPSLGGPVPAEVGPETSAEEHEAQGSPQGPEMPPPPTAEQMEQARAAYVATADRLDVAIRSANPGMEHPPAMSFEQLVQSVYMQAILQLGGGTQQGEQPQVDILGARQSIDMLGVLAEKTRSNLSEQEQNLLDSALFELQLAFLEITQVLARSAQARASQAGPGNFGPPAGPGAPTGPRIVR